jgi:hypothetical protein
MMWLCWGFIASLPPGKAPAQPATAICSDTWPPDWQTIHLAGRKTEKLTTPGPVQSRTFDLLGSPVPVLTTWPEATPVNRGVFAGQSPRSIPESTSSSA